MRRWTWLGVLAGACAVGGDAEQAMLAADQAAAPQTMLLEVTDPVVPGGPVRFRVTGAQPGAILWLVRSNGGVGPGGCPAMLGGACLDIQRGDAGYTRILELTADGVGFAQDSRRVPDRLHIGAVQSFQVVDVARGTASNPVDRVLQDPCTDDAYEDDDTPFDATPVQSGQQIMAQQCPNDADWYEIPAAAGQVIELTTDFDPTAADVDLRLYNAAGLLVDVANFARTAPEVISYAAPTQGPYYLEVYTEEAFDRAGTATTVTVNVSTPAVCVDDVFVGNDTAADAVALGTGAWDDLTLCDAVVFDWYSVDLDVGDTVDIDVLFDVAEGDIDAWLVAQPYGNDVNQLNRFYVARGISGTNDEHLTFTSGAAARYWLAVKLYRDAGGHVAGNTYDLDIAIR